MTSDRESGSWGQRTWPGAILVTILIVFLIPFMVFMLAMGASSWPMAITTAVLVTFTVWLFRWSNRKRRERAEAEERELIARASDPERYLRG